MITFLLTYVIPVFEETYDKAHVPLPFITQAVDRRGRCDEKLRLDGACGCVAVGVVVVRQLRKRADLAYKMDAKILRMPGVRQLAARYRRAATDGSAGQPDGRRLHLAEALGEAAQAVSNRAIQQSVRDLQNAVRRGEKFSRELERHGETFPPIVSQLVIVGEQTGTLTRATSHIRDHLQREIERKTNLFVGTIEPTLTISLGRRDRGDPAGDLSADVRHGEHDQVSRRTSIRCLDAEGIGDEWTSQLIACGTGG